jgi:hypothetical protein
MKARHIVMMVVAAMVGGGIINWLLQGQRAFAVSDSTSESVVAKEFRLVDSKGKTKTIFGTKEDDGPFLVLSDNEGNPRIMLHVDESKPETLSTIKMFDGTSDREVISMLVSNIMYSLSFIDKQKKASLSLAISQGKSVHPVLYMGKADNACRLDVFDYGVHQDMSSGRKRTINMKSEKEESCLVLGDCGTDIILFYDNKDCELLVRKNANNKWSAITKE